MKTRFVRVLCSLSLTFLANGARGDDSLKGALLRPSIEGMQKARRGPDPQRYRDEVEQFLNRPELFVVAAATDSSEVRFIAEATRIDKQIGPSNRSPGTTNLVSSGSVPRLLGFAVETGALTQTISGTTLTFQTNPAGLVTALSRTGFPVDPADRATGNTLNALRRINVGLVFDTSRENDGRFTGSYRQLQQFSSQIYIYNRRDPTHPAWTEVWAGFRESAGTALANSVRDLAVELNSDEFKKRRQATLDQLLDPSITDADIERLILAFVESVRPFIPERAAARVLSAWKNYLTPQRDVYNRIARSPILTFEYGLNRPPIQEAPEDVTAGAPLRDHPDLSVGRLVFVRPFIGASDMTVNVSLSFFNETRPEMRGNVRDVQVGGKLDFPLNGVFGVSKSQLTLAGLYMRLRQSPVGVPVIINGVQVDTKGDLGFVQARLRIPMGDSGFSIPFSVTYATRTELVNEKEIRANVGLTLDLDKFVNAP